MKFSFYEARRWLPNAALLAMLAGCSGQAVHGSTGETAAAFCQDWLTAIGSHAQTCTGTAQAAIDVVLSELHPCTDVSASIANQHLVFQEAYAAACLSEIEALPCWQSPKAASSCAKALAGTVPSGGACLPLSSALISECQPDGVCATFGTCPGTCLTLGAAGDATPGQLGDTCSLLERCISGLVCEGDGGPIDSLSSLPDALGTCQPPADSGPCDSDAQCRGKCAGTNQSTTVGSCVPWKALGDACAPGAKECATGTYCGSEGTCQLLSVIGESCAGNAGEGMACLDGYCDAQSLQCVPFLELGAACMLDAESAFPPDPCGGSRASCEQATKTCVARCFSSQ